MKITKKFIPIFLFLFLFIGLILLYLFNPLQFINTKNNNSTSETNRDQSVCTREKPFPNAQEFNDALDLIEERSKSAEDNIKVTLNPDEPQPRFFPALDSRNCIDIFYSDNIPDLSTTNAWFDSENSTPNHLIIKIDPKYEDQKIDNLVMAMLLGHELTHVRQFFDIKSGKEMTCIDQEVDAFLSQLRFLAILNKDEQPQIMELIQTQYYYVLGTLYDIWISQDKAATKCNRLQAPDQFDQNSFNGCYWDNMQTVTEEYLHTVPGYIEFCKL